MSETTVRIMEVLRRPRREYLSGQELSDTLGISRAAVWKHISALRGMGYAIEAVPSKGYRLTPASHPYNDLEISSGLTTTLIGRPLHFHRETSSTNETAFRMAKESASEGTAVVADSQSGGRGRLGRRWESPPGGIYTSIILRPPISPQDAPKLSLLAAVAVAEAVAESLPRPPSVKWPNDLLIDGKKVAGILAEMDAEMDRVNFIVIGIGVNVNIMSDGFPPEVRGIATSLREVKGEAVSRVEVIQSLYGKLEVWYDRFLRDGFAPVREAWMRFSEMGGRRVAVSRLGETIEGTALGIDEDGALLVRGQAGEVTRVTGGDVVVRR
ncbi:MAG: biotin--[acetyl-CoA-carboxylase] ligase [Thermodesulfobacteriota bacterium]